MLTRQHLSSSLFSGALFTSPPAFPTVKEMKKAYDFSEIGSVYTIGFYILIPFLRNSPSLPEKMLHFLWMHMLFTLISFSWLSLDKCVEVGPSLGWIKCSVEINYLLTWCRWSFSQRSGCHLLNKYLLRDYIVPWCSSWGIVYQHPYLGMTIVGKIHCSRKTECYRAVFSNIMAHVTILWKKICIR